MSGPTYAELQELVKIYQGAGRCGQIVHGMPEGTFVCALPSVHQEWHVSLAGMTERVRELYDVGDREAAVSAQLGFWQIRYLAAVQAIREAWTTLDLVEDFADDKDNEFYKAVATARKTLARFRDADADIDHHG